MNQPTKMALNYDDTKIGYWAHSGFGMVAFCLKDYEQIGGWDDKWGYHWGAEDVDIFQRGSEKFLPVRPLEKGFLYEKDSSHQTGKYYEDRNLYDKDLPISPVSIEITDQAFKKRLRDFAGANLDGYIDGKIDRVVRTYSKGGLYSFYTGSDTKITLDGQNVKHYWTIRSSLSPVLT